MEQFREESLGTMQQVRKETLGALNEVVDRNNKACQVNASLMTTLQEIVEGLKNELDTAKVEIRRLRTRLDANGLSGVTGVTPRLELPRPNTYNSSRKLKDVENFLYVMSLEPSFF
ncbi:unnamed protein product [Amaranthus hypochondriacus]